MDFDIKEITQTGKELWDWNEPLGLVLNWSLAIFQSLFEGE